MKEAGFIEVDLVSHSGNCGDGEFIYAQGNSIQFILDLLAACLVALWGFTGVRWILS